eukprot:gene14136-biopygen13013
MRISTHAASTRETGSCPLRSSKPRADLAEGPTSACSGGPDAVRGMHPRPPCPSGRWARREGLGAGAPRAYGIYSTNQCVRGWSCDNTTETRVAFLGRLPAGIAVFASGSQEFVFRVSCILCRVQ